jgi:hypothetical protein
MAVFSRAMAPARPARWDVQELTLDDKMRPAHAISSGVSPLLLASETSAPASLDIVCSPRFPALHASSSGGSPHDASV